MPKGQVSEATVARLPLYLQALVREAASGVDTLSSEGLAAASGVKSAKVRKDLSHLGSFGVRGVGYDVEELIAAISRALGITRDRRVAVVGVGNLGRALASYDGFAASGFVVAALLDADPAKIGTRIAGRTVEPFDALGQVVERRDISIGIVATPAAAAQEVAEALVAADVTAILTFAPAHLDVPERVSVRRVDVSTELQILSFYEQIESRAEAESA